jgi:uncharacterized protein YjbI with pentapeptide repeats
MMPADRRIIKVTRMSNLQATSSRGLRPRRRLLAAFQRRGEARRSIDWTVITSVVSLITSACAVVFTGLALNSTRDQVIIAREQGEVAEQGHFTDRYNKAIEQLDKAGNDHLQARLGAIYALERLALDSARDQQTIVEVLSAFVRTNTSRTGANGEDIDKCPLSPVRADVQASLTVLGRRRSGQRRTTLIELQKTCLRTAGLPNAQLTGMDLSSSNLGNSNLNEAILAKSYLYGAHLKNSLLRGADLNGTNLTGARLVGADMANADLSRANLTGADLRGANLSGVDLTGANLRDADLTDVRRDESTRIQDVRTNSRTVGKWW